MNKKQLKGAYKRRIKGEKFQFIQIRDRAKYAWRIRKAELKFKIKNASLKEEKSAFKRKKRSDKKDYKQELYLQKSIYLEKKNSLKKKMHEELGSLVRVVTDRAPESLAGNLTLGYLLIFLVFAILQGGLFVGLIYYNIDRRADETLTNTAASLQAGEIKEELVNRLSAETGLQITLWGADGASQFSYGLSEVGVIPQEPIQAEPVSLNYQGEPFKIYSVETNEGILSLVKSMKNEKAALSLMINLMLLSVALALAVSYFVGHRITRNLLRPIGVLGRAMKEISVKDLSKRLETENIRTELADVVGAYNRMLDKIEDAYLRQKQFVSDASHELRTPLAVISGYSDILARWGAEDPEVRKEAVDAILTQAEGMERLVERLLYIARSEDGALSPDLSYLDLAPICEEILQDFKMMHPDRKFILAGNGSALVEKDLLRQVLVILLDNAVKFTKADGEILLSLKEEDGKMHLTVADNGVGMSEEVAAHVFERFYKGDSSHNEKGFGLGLSLAKLMAEAQGAKISVASKEGEGSAFTIELNQ